LFSLSKGIWYLGWKTSLNHFSCSFTSFVLWHQKMVLTKFCKSYLDSLWNILFSICIWCDMKGYMLWFLNCFDSKLKALKLNLTEEEKWGNDSISDKDVKDEICQRFIKRNVKLMREREREESERERTYSTHPILIFRDANLFHSPNLNILTGNG